MSIEQTYRAMFGSSARRYERAQGIFPGGVTHDARYQKPFPLYIERSRGAHKWDADDNRLTDFVCGHGALLLGHAHPAIVGAVQAQVERGTHFGAGHDLELEWGALVQRLIPGAELVRFTSSGTEATMLALRLARAYTERPAVIRFTGHFHGWNDLIMPGAEPGDPLAGLLPAVAEQVITLPADLDAVAATLARRDDVAAVFLEPTGAGYGAVPLADAFLRELRTLTTDRDVLLICDEVVTGFRVTPGGAQRRAGVTADLTTLAKVLAGGLPGGAVTGRAEIVRHLAFGDAEWNAQHKVRHPGTYNANPLAAAAGVAALTIAATGEPQAVASARAQALVAGINDVLVEHRLSGWCAYGDASIFHLLAGAGVDSPPGEMPEGLDMGVLKRGGDPFILQQLRMAMLCSGIDLMRGRSGFVSAAHNEQDIAETVANFDRALGMLRADGVI